MSKKRPIDRKSLEIDPKLINFYLKKARNSVKEEMYEEAIEYYRLAAKCAAKAGDSTKERIFNKRAEEIIEEYGIEKEVKIEKKFKRKKGLKFEKKLKITPLGFWGFILTIIMIGLGFSGIFFEFIVFHFILTSDPISIADISFYWGIGILVEVIGVVLIMIIYKFLILGPEIEEWQSKK